MIPLPLRALVALAAIPALLLACGPDATTPAPAASAPGAAPPAAQLVAAVDPALPVVTVYKSPSCGCCASWVDHLRADGFRVEVVDMEDRSAIEESRGVPGRLAACHTAVVGDYVVEGHVPASDVRRLLDERPDAVGLAVPGMPMGSPGMEQDGQSQPYDVVLIGLDGSQTVFAHHGS